MEARSKELSKSIAESTRVIFLSSCVHTGGDVDLEDLQLKVRVVSAAGFYRLVTHDV